MFPIPQGLSAGAVTVIAAALSASPAPPAAAQSFGQNQESAGQRCCTLVTLGTNAGPVPNPQRAQPASLLETGQEPVLFDAGDGVARQLALASVSLRQIHTIFLSHLHFDHTGGLFALLAQRHQMLERSDVTVYGPPGTQALVASLMGGITASTRGGNAMLGSRPAEALTNVHTVELSDGQNVKIGSITIRAVRNTHFSATPGGDSPNSLSFAFRVDVAGKSMLYTGDTGPSVAVEQAAKGVDLLLSEVMDPDISMEQAVATLPGATEARLQAIRTHFTKQHMSPRAIGLLASGTGAQRLVLTHNALPDKNLASAAEMIAQDYRGKIYVARDLERFAF